METVQSPSGRPPENYLIWGILTTVLCCLPLGIVSIIKASKVNELWATGRHEEAYQAANEAKKWAIWSAILGPVLAIIGFIFFTVLGIGGAIIDGGY